MINVDIYSLNEKFQTFDPIRPSLFSRGGRGEGGGLRGPDAKNQGYHQLIEKKNCMSHYSLKSMPDANVQSGGFPFVEIWRHKIPSEEGNESLNLDIYSVNGFNFYKNEFLCPESFCSTQN